jgi:ABC-type transport system involved in cytochrome c biogenesis permease subunit
MMPRLLWLTRPHLLFFALPWLMVLLTTGTLAQKYIGLYRAQEMFFSSWILWIGPMPLPGTYLTLAVITFSLTLKFLVSSPWRMEKIGINLTHLGVLVLLIGGMVTAATQREGFMVLSEGTRSDTSSSYHERVFTVAQDNAKIFEISYPELSPGLLNVGDMSVDIRKTCRNCLPEAAPEDASREGIAAKVTLTDMAPEKEDEQNLSGLELTVSGKTFVLMERMSPSISHKGFQFSIGRKTTSLPFSIRLEKFSMSYYPGTNMARDYTSDVVVEDQGRVWPARIGMNEPLRYKGYTVYQSSFLEGPKDIQSVLSIVENKGRAFPYIGSIIIFAGLLVHLILRLRLTARKTTLAALFLSLVLSTPARAQDSFNYDAFSRIPVQHEGRIKPLESFARHYLKIFSGNDRGASKWLARSLFDPGAAAQDPIFKITSPEKAGLEIKPDRRYTFADISLALKNKTAVIQSLLAQNPEDWTADQRALMDMHDKAQAYGDILRSLTAVLPLAVDIPDALKKEWRLKDSRFYTLADIAPKRRDIDKKIRSLVSRKGDNLNAYTPDEKALALLSFQIALIEHSGTQSTLLRVIPPVDGGEEWILPWRGTTTSLQPWKDMAKAYHEGEAKAFTDATPTNTSARLDAEILYHALSPFYLSALLYFLSFLSLVAFTLTGKNMAHGLSVILAGAGLAIHLTGLALRIYILARPPVATLYESILFVAAAGVGAALWCEYRRRDGAGLLTAGVTGSILLTLAFGFAPDDTLKMLTAVLNTNFWLAVHVLCITLGYGWCIVTAVMAHICLARRDMDLRDTIKTLSILSLLFTTVGTILGGIWADQSWGRFWGWDPKENGALLIVLWLAWVLHGQITQHLPRLAALAALAYLNVIVALAWFGVNLLGTGLHSYGFTDGIALSLGIFCLAETIFVGYLWHRAAR